jgi:Mrp family chromosome partitioning ATPase
MSENCDNNCETCRVENCESRKGIQRLSPHKLTTIGKTIAIVSGKGGVGKSLVTSLLAVALENAGKRVAIMDADVTGPSIPKTFGLTEKAIGDENGIYAVKSKGGAAIMSVNLLLENDTDPVIWRGPMIANMVGQLYTNVIYGPVDYLLIDMPPGTGDVPLTVFQSISIDGLIIVTSPQELVSMVVAKAVNMAKMMNISILGLEENMAYVKCPHCGEKIELFGHNDIRKTAQEYGIKLLDEVPIVPELAFLADNGKIEEFKGEVLKKTLEEIAKL